MAYGNYKKPYQKSYPKKPATSVEPGSQYKPVLHPSEEQKAIFEAIADGTGSIIIDAFAGCGKTTACVESMWRVVKKNPRTTQGYLIFAKRNQEEAVGKCPPSVMAKTAHSFGLMTISLAKGKTYVDKRKTKRIAENLVGVDEEKEELRRSLTKAIDLGKDYLAETPQEIATMVDKHNIEIGDLSIYEFADKVLRGMDISASQPNCVSYSDMTWLPIKLGLKVPFVNIMFADELQDLNRARIELVMRSLGTQGRLIGVGDELQSIFGFTGADRHALNIIKQRANAINLPLHTTYRCGRAIVEAAKRYVPAYQAAPSNSDGEVRSATMQEMMGDEGAQPGDAILSRTNAPTIKVALRLLANGRRCAIQGKDIGENLLFMIKKSKAKDVISFQSWLEEWAAAEIERLIAKKKDYDHIEDMRDCLEVFCEGQRDILAVRAKIESMFDDIEHDDESKIIISTIHKFKGLERSTVWRLENSFTCRPKTEEEAEQERNIAYVSITRAKDRLLLVE
jgi:DNA helicase II / ATP-dependent DNA helicase PcrA